MTMKAALFHCLLHLFGVAVANPVPPEWEGPYDTGITISAAANLPDGNIVAWSAWDRMDFSNPLRLGQTYTVLINPFTHEIVEELIAHTKHDMFCPGTAILPDGLLMVTGGTGNARVSYYDYTKKEWIRGRNMVLSRGYHSMTVLGDGSVFTVGGSWNEGETDAAWDKFGELFKDGEWVAKPGIQSQPLSTNDARGPYRADNHMWLFTAPNGLIFHAGPSKQMNWIDVNGNNGDGDIIPSVLRGNDGDAMNGNAVMFDTGRILTCGGAPNYNFAQGTTNSFIIDIRSNDPNDVMVTKTGPMNHIRTLQNSVVLPTGEVVTIGGQEEARIFTDFNSVYHAEIWSPVTGQWTELGAMQIPRNYHAVALLLKDGKVWVSGSGLCGTCDSNHPDFEVLSPPYLRTGAARPEIVSATDRLEYLGDDPNIQYQQITITMSTTDSYTFALIRLSAGTHAVNNDVRRIPLQNAVQVGNNWAADVEANRNIAIPGTYFLFAMDVNNVPSEAVIVTIEGDDDGPYTPPPEPTASPSGAECFADCLVEENASWLCDRTWGCEGCVAPVGDVSLKDACEKFCQRCDDRGTSHGGLNCDCTTPEPTNDEVCWNDCRVENGKDWLCGFAFGCQDCPLEDTCEKLCSRCDGVTNVAYGGLQCDCEYTMYGGTPSASPVATPTASPVTAPTTSPVAAPTISPVAAASEPPGPSGDCFSVCEKEEYGKWICDNSNGCEGCEKETTCEKLCRRCEGIENNMYGGLDCDCSSSSDPAPSPAPQTCLNVCGRETKGKWICDNSVGCEGCDKQSTCEKLCSRCDGLQDNLYGGLDCDCTGVGECFAACAASSGGAWVCNKEAGCEGCSDHDDICAKLCSRCGLTGDQDSVAGLTCDCTLY